jgi:hypothetical protein
MSRATRLRSCAAARLSAWAAYSRSRGQFGAGLLLAHQHLGEDDREPGRREQGQSFAQALVEFHARVQQR